MHKAEIMMRETKIKMNQTDQLCLGHMYELRHQVRALSLSTHACMYRCGGVEAGNIVNMSMCSLSDQ
jgi:hypothetical protein